MKYLVKGVAELELTPRQHLPLVDYPVLSDDVLFVARVQQLDRDPPLELRLPEQMRDERLLALRLLERLVGLQLIDEHLAATLLALLARMAVLLQAAADLHYVVVGLALLEKGHGVDLLLLLIGVVIAAIQFQIGDVEVSLNIISFERSSQHRVILRRTRSATHRKSFQSHIIVFYSKIFFLKIRSSAHVILFFQKINN